jgi:hypothetical protein
MEEAWRQPDRRPRVRVCGIIHWAFHWAWPLPTGSRPSRQPLASPRRLSLVGVRLAGGAGLLPPSALRVDGVAILLHETHRTRRGDREEGPNDKVGGRSRESWWRGPFTQYTHHMGQGPHPHHTPTTRHLAMHSWAQPHARWGSTHMLGMRKTHKARGGGGWGGHAYVRAVP